jgi:hypothetical protein
VQQLLLTVAGIGGLIVGLTAPLHVFVRLWQGFERIGLLLRGHRVTAVVDTFEEFEVGEDGHRYIATVAFVTGTGQRRVAELREAVRSLPPIGSRIDIVYRPHDPGYAAEPKVAGTVLTVVFAPFILLLAATVTPIFASMLFRVDIPATWYLVPFRN